MRIGCSDGQGASFSQTLILPTNIALAPPALPRKTIQRWPRPLDGSPVRLRGPASTQLNGYQDAMRRTEARLTRLANLLRP